MGSQVALVEKCSLVIAPDSAFIYIAESLGVPVIGLYGPFSSELRTKGLNVHTIESTGVCYNCCEHSAEPCRMSQDSGSPCLKAISPQMVLEVAKDILSTAKGEKEDEQ